MKYLNIKIKRIFHSQLSMLNWGLIVCCIASLSFTSCNDDDDTPGLPIITAVRKTTNPDSTFTRSFPGQMIVIEGQYLSGTQHIYFNEAEASFNPNYVTDNNIIVTIPGDIPLKGQDSSASNEIRVMTGKGEARYSFQFLSPAPSISLLYYMLPSAVGDPLLIIGFNFYEVEKIVFRSEQGNVETKNFTVNATYDQISLNIPEGAINKGFVDVHCLTAVASKEFDPTAVPIAHSVNSDMPIVGDKVIISGEYLFGIEKIILPGGKEITSFTVNATNSEVSFIMPADVPVQGGKLALATANDIYEVPGFFYPFENVIVDLDTKGWYSWGDNNVVTTADPSKAPYTSTEKYINIFGKPGAWQYWWGNIVMGFSGWPTSIADHTPIDNLVLRFSFYTELPLEKGFFQMQIGGRWTDAVPAAINPEWKPYLNNAGDEVGSKPGKWVDYEVPLFNFGSDLHTYADIKNLKGEMGFFFKNSSDDADLTLNVFFDNIRVIDKTK